MNEEIILEKEMFYITYFDEKELSFREHYEVYKNIKNDILHVLNKYNIKFVLAETKIIKDLQQENARLKDNYKQLEKFICYEQDRLLKATSHTYQDSFNKIKFVNSDIFEELKKVENKMKELFKEN